MTRSLPLLILLAVACAPDAPRYQLAQGGMALRATMPTLTDVEVLRYEVFDCGTTNYTSGAPGPVPVSVLVSAPGGYGLVQPSARPRSKADNESEGVA